MTILSEDPTYLGGALTLLGVGLLVALRVTQRGKYLVWALVALGLAVVVVVVEQLWVTDNERIERVVYQLRDAVAGSDVDGVLRHLAPDVQFVQGGDSLLSGEAARSLIRANLANTTFDFVRISELQASAGRQTRRGKAEFRVFAKGTLKTGLGTMNVGTANSTWSLGFGQTAPGVWTVNRITPVSLPDGALVRPMTPPSLGRPGGFGPANPQNNFRRGRSRGRP